MNGGLDLAVQSVFGGSLAWVSDIEPGPSRILAHHHPDVPNLGDITTVGWTQVEPVDIICGGSPCQDLSHAGARAGMRDGTRSGLWASMCEAIETIRPAYVIWENVLGALSASADSDMGPCEFGMGCEGSVPLRALGRVLGDLAEVGYDAAWTTLAAADIGAPHRRERIFVLAWGADAADADPVGRAWGGATRDRLGGPTDGGRGDVTLLPGDLMLPSTVVSLLPTPDAQMGNGGRVQSLESLREGRRQVHMNDLPRLLLPTPRTSDTNGPGHHGDGGVDLRTAVTLLPTPKAGDADFGFPRTSGRPAEKSTHLATRLHYTDFGQYAPAIARWEAVLGREAPAPTEPTTRGTQRLSTRFVEWMMGLPDGHVTAVPGLSRNAQLKALGNGVVPAQAAAALRHLLFVRDSALEAA